MTFDKDFGEMVFRRKLVNNGVILIRLSGLSQVNKSEIVKRVLQEHAEEIYKSFTVITAGAVRIRR